MCLKINHEKEHIFVGYTHEQSDSPQWLDFSLSRFLRLLLSVPFYIMLEELFAQDGVLWNLLVTLSAEFHLQYQNYDNYNRQSSSPAVKEGQNAKELLKAWGSRNELNDLNRCYKGEESISGKIRPRGIFA